MIKNPWYGKWIDDDGEEKNNKRTKFTPCLDADKEEKQRKQNKSYPCITRKATKEELEKAFK